MIKQAKYNISKNSFLLDIVVLRIALSHKKIEIKVSLVASASARADKIFTECAEFSTIQRLRRLDSY